MDTQVVICGLPNTGKTTFLAALWHLLFSGEVETVLSFDSLPGDREHLNVLADRWRQCLAIERTDVGSEKYVVMNFADGKRKLSMSFPDLSGEIWNAMWEERVCPSGIASLTTTSEGILLFVHADNVALPKPLTEAVVEAKILGDELRSGTEISWSPSLAPTQVVLVDILQMLAALRQGRPPRLVVMLSAWDLAEEEGKTPDAYLADRLPLLWQYLESGCEYTEWKVYGVSAQGGDLEKDRSTLIASDKQSLRIKVVEGEGLSHDLTRPLKWLME